MLAAAKTPIRGLIDMQDIAWHNTDNATTPPFTTEYIAMFPGLFGGIVINATWAQMQPTRDGAVDFSAVDSALAQVQAYNRTSSAPVSVKLRIYAGSNAPHWAKDMRGGPITIYRNPAGCRGQKDTCVLTLGPFWTRPYIDAWRSFQAAVAAKYDNDPLVAAVAVTSCAEQTDEPFVASGGPISKRNLRDAGLTDDLQQTCLLGATTDYAAWQNTDIDFTFNTYNKLSGGLNGAFTERVMRECRRVAGARCVLDNHGLATPVRGDGELYATMQRMGGLINFQTEAPGGMGCLWPETITQGIIVGARAIEVWPEAKFGGFTTLSVPNVQQLHDLFYAPVPASTPVPQPLPAPCRGFN
jgi:hypothetical protein